MSAGEARRMLFLSSRTSQPLSPTRSTTLSSCRSSLRRTLALQMGYRRQMARYSPPT
jgi:hypothetical protein